MRLLFITPHLSTGGLPQFLLKKIEVLNDEFDIWCIEWDNITGGQLVVQRNQIENLLGNKLITMNKKEEFIQIIDEIKPDVIHFEEFPETFIPHPYLNFLYKSRYKICETTHGTGFDVNEKVTTPDKSLFVSKYNLSQYFDKNSDFDLIEYPVKSDELKRIYFKELGLDPNKKHVLNVGLFTPGKNQAEIFDLAREFDDSVQFHFLGNQAGNFEFYWKPLMTDKPNNCTVWGERNDVYKFYTIADLFLFTSNLENKPLCISEALNYNLPILMKWLPNYSDIFTHKNIDYLSVTKFDNVSKIKQKLKIENTEILSVNTESQKTFVSTIEKTISDISTGSKISAYHMLTDIDSDREISSLISLSKLSDWGIDYQTCINKRYTKLPPSENCEYPDKISMEPGGKLTPGHYGCYLAHKSAFYQGVQSDSDFILIFECDAVIDVDYKEFIEKLNFACKVLDTNEELLMFSFGYHNNTNIVDKKDNYWVVNKFYGAHAYLIPKRSFTVIDNMYQTCKWNVTDLLFAEKLDMYKTGIFETPITKQAAGLSILDKVYHEERY